MPAPTRTADQVWNGHEKPWVFHIVRPQCGLKNSASFLVNFSPKSSISDGKILWFSPFRMGKAMVFPWFSTVSGGSRHPPVGPWGRGRVKRLAQQIVEGKAWVNLVMGYRILGIYIYIYTHVYIYIYTSTSTSIYLCISLSLYIYIHAHTLWL